jgi:hypothetical protein
MKKAILRLTKGQLESIFGLEEGCIKWIEYSGDTSLVKFHIESENVGYEVDEGWVVPSVSTYIEEEKINRWVVVLPPVLDPDKNKEE